ncbi:MAG: hydantoinase/oxoprolinase family protein [Pseudomonadota bacterium]
MLSKQAESRIAADVGGTFTDIAIFDEASGAIRLGKCLTTPTHLIDGINDGVKKSGASFDQANLFLHGTTVAINTLLERSGAHTALVTTRGFRDIYEIGRINRPEAYNLFFQKHRPLIERELRFETDERLLVSGAVLRPLAEADLAAIGDQLERDGVEALAIMFMHSYRNAEHESQAKRYFEQRFPAMFITASHELSQEYREYERTSTVAANAYIGPRVRSYLSEIVEHLEQKKFGGGFLIVQSTGGLYDVDSARKECIRMLESGPAAGVIGTRELCRMIGIRDAIAFDMGGTTAKSGVILGGDVLMTSNSMIGGYAEGLPVQIPMIDIQEVGTGGGSIARLAAGDSLRVGPQSAGSVPGPVCYGLGGEEPTVTDANLILGRLSESRFLGGDMRLNADAARQAMENRIGRPLGLDAEVAAEGVIRIATSTMSNVVKRVTTERGLDARDFPMVAFGGAGPLHAVLVARELQMPRVIIPNAPGHFSAYGMLVADLRRDYVRTRFTPLEDVSFPDLNALYQDMEAEGTGEIRRAAVHVGAIRVTRGLDMRYVGQEHAVSVEIPVSVFDAGDWQQIKRLFDAVHLQRYGYCSDAERAEIVSIRTSVSGDMPKPTIAEIAAGGPEPEAAPEIRPVYFSAEDGWQQGRVYQRAGLRAGNRIAGPALIEEYASTTVILSGDHLEVDKFGNLIIEVANNG